MDSPAAIEAFGALAQETRLAVFRLLMHEGLEGLPAGVIAKRLGIRPSTLSGHLGVLARAKLVRASRQQRQIIYAADIEGIQYLLKFLTDNCCQGHPEICDGLTPGDVA